MTAKAIMVQGTCSNAGKSIITAGLCRIFKEDGYKVAPFKSQNMALNSYITEEGLEMGRAQAVQAEAAGIAPSVRMNPILLKPTNEKGSQVILHGEVIGNISAANYYQQKKKLYKHVVDAYNDIAEDYDIIVIEGAGSPAEINLNENDFVNMGMAKIADAPVLLVGDIDRGGVFASLYGTVELLPKEDQDRIQGLIINKFRGDVSILEPGLKQLEDIMHKDILGVLPYLDVDIDDEDSLSSKLAKTVSLGAIDIAVVRLPKISNFTDFNSLERFDFVSVRYVRSVKEIGNPDLIIIPGTKNTIADLMWMRESGIEAKLIRLASTGTALIGICGGYQMLGKEIHDPENTEQGGSIRGMGLLDSETIFKSQKTRTRVEGSVSHIEGRFEKLNDATFEGYEIHNGTTEVFSENIMSLSNRVLDGACKDNVLGCYIHGVFDKGDFAEKLMEILLDEKGISDMKTLEIPLDEYKNQQYAKLAAGMRKYIDINRVYEILNVEKK